MNLSVATATPRCIVAVLNHFCFQCVNGGAASSNFLTIHPQIPNLLVLHRDRPNKV